MTIPLENMFITPGEADRIEDELRLKRHVERYLFVRQFLYGQCLDAACGSGYGAYLCAKNPDVDVIIGIDRDPRAIEFARRNEKAGRLQFVCSTIAEFPALRADILIALETIEHTSYP